VLGGLIAYPMAQAKDLLKLYREITSTAPDELGLYAVLATLPDGTKAAVILVCYIGPVEEGERLLKPLRTFGPPPMDQVMPMPYPALQSMAQNFNLAGVRNYWKSSYLRELSEDAMDVMIEYFATSLHPLTHVVMEHHGGAISRVGEGDMACSHRKALYNFLIVGMWTNPEEDGRTPAGSAGSSVACPPSRWKVSTSTMIRTRLNGSGLPTPRQSMNGWWP
jgi:hypothetical protein